MIAIISICFVLLNRVNLKNGEYKVRDECFNEWGVILLQPKAYFIP